jgi:hypothetical protein
MAERGLPPQLYYPSDLKGKNKAFGVEEWWAHQDLNLGPIDYESTALTS